MLSEGEAEALARHRAIGLDVGGHLRLDVTPKDAKIIDEKGLYGPISEAARSFLGVEGLALSNKPQAKVAAPIVTDEPLTHEGRAFIHSFFTHVGLPRGRPKNPDGTPATEFERRSKRAVLHVSAGWMESKGQTVRQMLPYGTRPRLMLVDICTEALRNRDPVVDLGGSARAYLANRLLIESSGGSTGSYTHFKKQCLALVTCSVRMFWLEKGRTVTFQGMPVEGFEAWATDNEYRNRGLWPGRLKLSGSFYETLLQHGMPIQRGAYWSLSGSSLAMDAYFLLANQMWRIDGSQLLTWKGLHEGLGQEYKRLIDFKRKFRAAVKAAQDVYPDSVGRVEETDEGLLLYHALPPVPSAGGR